MFNTAGNSICFEDDEIFPVIKDEKGAKNNIVGFLKILHFVGCFGAITSSDKTSINIISRKRKVS